MREGSERKEREMGGGQGGEIREWGRFSVI